MRSPPTIPFGVVSAWITLILRGGRRGGYPVDTWMIGQGNGDLEGAFISWDAFARFLTAVKRDVRTERDWVALGAGMGSRRSFPIAKSIISPYQLVRWNVRHAWPRVQRGIAIDLPSMTSPVTERMRLRFRSEPSIRVPKEFYCLCAGQLATIPQAIGLPAAHAAVRNPSEEGVCIDLLLPSSRTLLHRCRRRLGAVQTSQEAIATLAVQHQEIVESYREMAALKSDFQEMMESNPEGVLIHQEGTILYANPALAQSLGVASPTALIGQDFAAWLTEDSRLAWHQCLTEMKNTPEVGPRLMQVAAASARRKEPTYLELHTVKPIQFADRQGHLVMVQDVTEQRRLEREILNVSDSERQQLAFDLHDGMGQLLTGIAFQSKALHARAKDTAPELASQAAQLVSLANDAIRRSRTLARGLNPVSEFEGGFIPALQHLARVTQEIYGISVLTKLPKDDIVLTTMQETQLYRIAQEAINNALRHGHPSELTLALIHHAADSSLSLHIGDNGSGFDKEDDAINTHLGLRIMRHRAHSIGATFEIQHLNPGTAIHCHLRFDPAVTPIDS